MSVSEEYEKITAYISDNPAAVLSTIDDDGGPYGAVIYVCPDNEQPVVYFLTKDGTRKFKNISDRTRVGLTIVNEKQNSTLQATGTAAVVHDARYLDLITRKMYDLGPHSHAWVPPISKINAGKYKLVGVTLRHVRLAEFSTDALEDEPTVTELDT